MRICLPVSRSRRRGPCTYLRTGWRSRTCWWRSRCRTAEWANWRCCECPRAVLSRSTPSAGWRCPPARPTPSGCHGPAPCQTRWSGGCKESTAGTVTERPLPPSEDTPAQNSGTHQPASPTPNPTPMCLSLSDSYGWAWSLTEVDSLVHIRKQKHLLLSVMDTVRPRSSMLSCVFKDETRPFETVSSFYNSKLSRAHKSKPGLIQLCFKLTDVGF